MSHTPLAGRVAIITGTSSGIGLATASLFLDAGAKVLGADRSPPDATLAQRPGFASHTMDLTQPGAADAVVAACAAAFGDVDILINNAGIGNARPILETTDEDLARYLAVNVAAPFAMARACIRVMQRRGGAIVNMASAFGMIGAASSAGYAPTKAAMIGMTQQLATEYGRDGIRVNAIAPGMIATPLTQDRLANNAWYRRMMLDGCPMARPGAASDVAQACLFLASDAAGFISGVVLPVDGGWSGSKFLPRPVGFEE
jgi:NAD(P)-dependent dehydrogenase (short-subunit alcohol dehydrogenase family)